MATPKLKMIEIYSGKNEDWKGQHNLVLDVDGNASNSKSIQGPIDPETSKQLKLALGMKEGQQNEIGIRRAWYYTWRNEKSA